MTTDPVPFRERYTRSEWIRLWVVLSLILIGIIAAMAIAQGHQGKRCDYIAAHSVVIAADPQTPYASSSDNSWYTDHCM
jgi:hypothetical protein